MAGFGRLSLSQGERAILASYAVVGLSAGVICSVATLRLADENLFHATPGVLDLWIFAAGMFGGVAGIFAGQSYLGQVGAAGLLGFFQGFIVINFFAALAGGTLVLPFYGTMFGILAVVGAFVAYPWLAAIWIVSVWTAHFARAVYNRERDSIFAAQRGVR